MVIQYLLIVLAGAFVKYPWVALLMIVLLFVVILSLRRQKKVKLSISNESRVLISATGTSEDDAVRLLFEKISHQVSSLKTASAIQGRIDQMEMVLKEKSCHLKEGTRLYCNACIDSAKQNVQRIKAEEAHRKNNMVQNRLDASEEQKIQKLLKGIENPVSFAGLVKALENAEKELPGVNRSRLSASCNLQYAQIEDALNHADHVCCAYIDRAFDEICASAVTSMLPLESFNKELENLFSKIENAPAPLSPGVVRHTKELKRKVGLE